MMVIMKRILTAVWVVCVVVTSVRAQEPIDLLLYNGKIFSADEQLSDLLSGGSSRRSDRRVRLGWPV